MELRKGVSGYLEVFILVAIALGGAGLVFGASATLLEQGSGQAIALASASIRQGPNSALESVTVANGGFGLLGNFTLNTSSAPSSASFCYTVEDAGTGSLLDSTCPATPGAPGRVGVAVSVKAGETVVVELIILGTPYPVGSTHQVSIVSSTGGQASAEVQSSPE